MNECYECEYVCMNLCVCGMNVYECVCESVSEWNECDMSV